MSFHPRNRHQGRYDLQALIRTSPEFSKYVAPNPYGDESIDFSDPEAVKALNRALLKHYYGIEKWDVPQGYLCPPIPGRADYIHAVADLLGSSNNWSIPQGPSVRVLDIGVGANCIYPMIGSQEYGWSFVGTEVDVKALQSAQNIIDANSKLLSWIELRQQKSQSQIFKGIVEKSDSFFLVLCNPPFHSSLEEARAGTQRKWKNLGKEQKTVLNFGGQSNELWCEGGERAFIQKMIEESPLFKNQILWFTSIISKDVNVPTVTDALKKVRPVETRIIEMSQGQKKSRLIAWTFATKSEQAKWMSRG